MACASHGVADVLQIYERSAAAYGALEQQLQGAGPYLFGQRPCSLDAALLAQLAFHKHCPAVAPELKAQVINPLSSHTRTDLERNALIYVYVYIENWATPGNTARSGRHGAVSGM